MKRTNRPAGTSWLAGFFVFLILGYVTFGSILSRNIQSQPILYNHSIHIENGMTCQDCHTGSREQVQATLPTLDTCISCHEEALTENPEEEKIRTLAAANTEAAWVQLTRVPRHVYFSHRRHVAQGEMECAECHGPMETRTEPPREPFRPITMEACMGCHEQRNVRNDCNDCHR